MTTSTNKPKNAREAFVALTQELEARFVKEKISPQIVDEAIQWARGKKAKTERNHAH